MQKKIKDFLEQYLDCIRKNAAGMMDEAMPEADEALFSLFEKTGNRLRYEDVYFTRRKYLAVFGLLSILDGSEAYVKKLTEVLKGICREECWALPAHVHRDTDPDWRVCVDLFASETGQALAEILGLAGEKLSEDVRKMVRENIFRRVMDPFLKSSPPYQHWEGGDNNWNAVCCGSIGCIGMYLMQDEPERLQELLKRLQASLTHYIDGFAEDGACMEGLDYFSYGFAYYVGFAEMLRQYTKGETDLLAQEKCRRIALFQQKCYFPSGRTLSFSDGNSRDTYRMGLTCRLAMRWPELEIPPVSVARSFEGDSCYRFLCCLRDVLWTREYLERQEKEKTAETEPAAGRERFLALPSAQWYIAHGRSGGGMACKGGHNGEPHNHNDVGSFLYLLGDEMLLTDLGAGEYTRQYFGPQRYEILCNNSFGHSVPVLDGSGQKDGREYGCSGFSADEKGGCEIHFAGAYGDGRVKDLCRSFRYDPDTEVLEIADRLEAETDVPMWENLVTQYRPVIRNGQVWITGKDYACRVETGDLAGGFLIEEKKHSSHKGVLENVYCISWEVPAGKDNPGERSCRFRIVPVWEEARKAADGSDGQVLKKLGFSEEVL
ncbi:MAG TPA: heparinase II/III-family protein [Candidatus Eisenbergiella intestinipullorum]|nr:heparinase II/III-family protein [Candidatus Eisenbergiella intestinipullorum]